jgi:hypothetical protein
MAPDLVDQNVLATQHHWQHLYNRFGDQGQEVPVVMALSGIDIALWFSRDAASRRPGNPDLGINFDRATVARFESAI